MGDTQAQVRFKEKYQQETHFCRFSVIIASLSASSALTSSRGRRLLRSVFISASCLICCLL